MIDVGVCHRMLTVRFRGPGFPTRVRFLELTLCIYVFVPLCIWILNRETNTYGYNRENGTVRDPPYLVINWTEPGFLLTDLQPKQSDGDQIPVSYRTHAFYYAWYDAPDEGQQPTEERYWVHWNHARLLHWIARVASAYPKGKHHPPGDIASSFYPVLGPYRSKSLKVMHAHMRMARFAGIGVLVLSWYPKGLADANGKPVDDLVLPLLNVAQSYGLKVCLHIEPYGNRTAASVASDLIYAHFRGYTTHPAYFRLPRRLGNGSDTTLLPVFFVYDSYRISNLEWTSILSTDGAMSIRKKAHDGYMIGLLMEITSCQNLRDSGFDGGYTYFVGSSTSEASSTSNWKKLSVSCLAAGLEFYPSIGPGYHDLSIRPWNRKTVVARSGGDKFYESYSAATKVTPSGLGITSFNEWHEGSQVEPAVPKSGPHSYMDYSPFSPEFYLRLVRLFVNHFEGFTSLPHSFWLAPDNEVNRLKKINDTLSLL